jgi:hypothetical protein
MTGVQFDIVAACLSVALAAAAALVVVIRVGTRNPYPVMPVPASFDVWCPVPGCGDYLGACPSLADAAWEDALHRVIAHDDAHRGTRP